MTYPNMLQIEQLSQTSNSVSMLKAGYQVRVSEEIEDSAWDAFVAEISGGHHLQTSLWAQVKATAGWQAIRIIITQEARIVAGMQILARSLPYVGAIGYLSKGPLIAENDPCIIRLIFDALAQVSKTHRLVYLTIQPPNNNEGLAQHLVDEGFRLSSVNLAPTATVLIDLTQDIDQIMANMSAKTRYNVRLSQRKGITVREGTAQDLNTYYRILVETGRRQNFSPYPKHYFTEMWRILSPHGHIKLFLAELEGDVVAAQLTVPFGDTVINKLSVWSGQHGNCRPNEAIQMAVIVWAKSQGYHYYDLEGIKPSAARVVLGGVPLPANLKQTVTSFKLGFGGEVTLFPEAYDTVTNPLLRWAYTKIYPRISNQRIVKQAVKRFRTG